MSEVPRRPEGTSFRYSSALGPVGAVEFEAFRQYTVAIEAALVKVTEALRSHECTSVGLFDRERDALALAAPLISQIPAPQKESR